jgi:hypothetical protein
MPRKKKPTSKDLLEPVHSQDELDDLSAFCTEIEHAEIPFEEWQSCHAALDLRIPLFLAHAELLAGTQKTVTFCRTITEQDGQGRRREPASAVVTVPAAAAAGDTIVLRGLGDRLGSTIGDVLIVLDLK